jgi:hypothetical protein
MINLSCRFRYGGEPEILYKRRYYPFQVTVHDENRHSNRESIETTSLPAGPTSKRQAFRYHAAEAVPDLDY